MITFRTGNEPAASNRAANEGGGRSGDAYARRAAEAGHLEAYFAPFRRQVIGGELTFATPYGRKKLIYADWTASGRLYAPIERRLCVQFGPYAANPHTEANVTAAATTLAYREARDIIKRHVGANEQDALFTFGTGATAAICKLQRIMGLRAPEPLNCRIHLSEEERPIVFITHMEHHSNHISWLETTADVVVLEPGPDGRVDPAALAQMLAHYDRRKLKIGAFTACSNVTGIETPYRELARLMHQAGGIAVVDFSACAPYVPIEMHPADPLAALDAIVFSPHKFLGGPGTSGVLVLDSHLCRGEVPDQPGGGTVVWTNPWGDYLYVESLEQREDGGTPGYMQAIRTALCIKLKEAMGTEKMQAREGELLSLLLERLERIPGLYVLDGHIRKRLGIVSFHLEGMHYNLVVKLLNDRFGIQARGGCSCAGTYGHYLFGIDKETSAAIAKQIGQGNMQAKPGWVRLSLHPIMTDQEVFALAEAVEQIAAHGEEWASDYRYDPQANHFRHIREEAVRPKVTDWFDMSQAGF